MARTRYLSDSRSSVLGAALLVLGAIALLGQMGVLRALGDLIIAGLFAAAGVYLIRSHRRLRGEPWRLLAGFGLLGVAAAAVLGPLSGPAFLGLAGTGFVMLYRERRDRWWALMTGGALLTLALTALVPGLLRGGLLFLGLAVVFLYLHRHPAHRKSWAIYPAVGLLLLAGLAIVSLGGWLLPVALVLAGAYLLRRPAAWEAVPAKASVTAGDAGDA